MNGRTALPRSRHQFILNTMEILPCVAVLGRNGCRLGLSGVFVRRAALFVLIPAFLWVGTTSNAFAEGKHKPQHRPAVAAAPIPSRAVAYEPDGTPIATGEPRRLSRLAAPAHSLALNRSPTRKPVAALPPQQVR